MLTEPRIIFTIRLAMVADLDPKVMVLEEELGVSTWTMENNLETQNLFPTNPLIQHIYPNKVNF